MVKEESGMRHSFTSPELQPTIQAFIIKVLLIDFKGMWNLPKVYFTESKSSSHYNYVTIFKIDSY